MQEKYKKQLVAYGVTSPGMEKFSEVIGGSSTPFIAFDLNRVAGFAPSRATALRKHLSKINDQLGWDAREFHLIRTIGGEGNQAHWTVRIIGAANHSADIKLDSPSGEVIFNYLEKSYEELCLTMDLHKNKQGLSISASDEYITALVSMPSKDSPHATLARFIKEGRSQLQPRSFAGRFLRFSMNVIKSIFRPILPLLFTPTFNMNKEMNNNPEAYLEGRVRGLIRNGREQTRILQLQEIARNQKLKDAQRTVKIHPSTEINRYKFALECRAKQLQEGEFKISVSDDKIRKLLNPDFIEEMASLNKKRPPESQLDKSDMLDFLQRNVTNFTYTPTKEYFNEDSVLKSENTVKEKLYKLYKIKSKKADEALSDRVFEYIYEVNYQMMRLGYTASESSEMIRKTLNKDLFSSEKVASKEKAYETAELIIKDSLEPSEAATDAPIVENKDHGSHYLN